MCKAIVICMLVVGVATGAVQFGVSVGGRLGAPIYQPFIDIVADEWTLGAQYGFSAMFDVYLFEGFAVGPYLGGMFRVDRADVEIGQFRQESEIITNELMYGIGISYGFNPEGINPWLRIAACYTDFTNAGTQKVTVGEEIYRHEFNSEGEGFALDAALGVDFPLEGSVYLGVGVDYHYSNVRKVVWDDLDEEHAEQEWNESPQALGGVVTVGFLF